VGDPTDTAAVWSAVVGKVEGQRALAWVRKTALVSLTPGSGSGGRWEAVIEPLPGHGDLVGFATAARLAPVGVVMGQVLGGRVTVKMRARRGEAPAERGPVDEAQTVDDLPLVKRMKEVFADYNVRLIAQRRETPPGISAGEASDAPEEDEDDA